MPRFLVLIYGDEKVWAQATPEWDEENGRRHKAWLDSVGSAVRTGGEVVLGAQAISIRGDDPAATASPGPFVQADKGIGGFYLIEADDLDAAIDLARGIPEASTPHSGVEIRQMP